VATPGTGFNPATNGSAYTESLGTLRGVHALNETLAGGTGVLGGVANTDNLKALQLAPKWSDGNNYSSINTDTGSNAADYSASDGLLTMSRNGTTVKYYKGATLVKTLDISLGNSGLPTKSWCCSPCGRATLR
jgi:hypothetical protein